MRKHVSRFLPLLLALALLTAPAALAVGEDVPGLPQASLTDTAALDLINQVQLSAAGADVSAAALTGDALPQSLSADDLAGVCSANDTLVRVTVTGAELKAYLEWAAACYNQWKSGDIGISFQPERPAHTRDVFAGVDYELDLSKPAGERVQNVRFRGAPLSDDQQLKLVVSSERYAVQLKGQSLISGEYDWSSRQTLGALISDYLAGHAAPAAADGNWSITGVDLSLDSAERATLVALIRSGQLETPYAKSLNLNHYEVKNLLASANNVKLTDLDQFGTAASFADADGVPYFRLRDLAFLFTGSKDQFNVRWDGKVVVQRGQAYDGGVLPLPWSIPASAAAVPPAEITVSVDGADVRVSAIAVDGHYYLSVEGVNALLGTSATVQDKTP